MQWRANPDLQIRGEGVGAVIQTLRWGGEVSKKIFRPLGSQFDLKIRGGGGAAPQDPPLDPLLKCLYREIQKKIAYLGYSDKLRIQSKSKQRLWKLREK